MNSFPMFLLVLLCLGLTLFAIHFFSVGKHPKRKPLQEENHPGGWTNTAIRRQGKDGKGIR